MTTTAVPPAPQKVAYKSPKHAQVWFLKRSRDLWKKKHQHLKAQAKRLQNRVADLDKSRAHWRARAEAAERQLALCSYDANHTPQPTATATAAQGGA
jgi:septal ring factor EnvC (AmiA/AmiB activator)